MRELKGYIVPILTPFNRDGSLDEQAMRESISYLIAEGIHGISLAGSFGEFPLLNSKERKRLFEVGVDEGAGRCALIAGTGHASTDEVIRLSQAAEKIGADGQMIVPPYYLLPSERDLKEHFRRINAATRLPTIIYNNPPRTGVNMRPELLMELSKLEHVVSIKQSSTSFFELLELIRLTEDRSDFHITNGQEMWAFPAFMMGAEAAYGISPLLIGRECIDMYHCAKNGDLQRGRAIQYKVNQFRSAIARCNATPAAAVRALARKRGLAVGYSRAPIVDISDEDWQILNEAIDAVGLESVEQAASVAS